MLTNKYLATWYKGVGMCQELGKMDPSGWQQSTNYSLCMLTCKTLCMCVSVCVACAYICQQFVLLLEVVFSHDSLRTLSFDQHLMYREQVNDHTSCNGSTVVLRWPLYCCELITQQPFNLGNVWTEEVQSCWPLLIRSLMRVESLSHDINCRPMWHS